MLKATAERPALFIPGCHPWPQVEMPFPSSSWAEDGLKLCLPEEALRWRGQCFETAGGGGGGCTWLLRPLAVYSHTSTDISKRNTHTHTVPAGYLGLLATFTSVIWLASPLVSNHWFTKPQDIYVTAAVTDTIHKTFRFLEAINTTQLSDIVIYVILCSCLLVTMSDINAQHHKNDI